MSDDFVKREAGGPAEDAAKAEKLPYRADAAQRPARGEAFKELVRDAFLYRSPRDTQRLLGRSLVYLTFLIGIYLAGYGHVLFRRVPLYPDRHLRLSLDLAANRVFCGRSSHLSSVSIAGHIASNPDLMERPIQEVLVEAGGSAEAYCKSVVQPYVNNENSLMYLFHTVLALRPQASVSEIGLVVRVTHLVLIAVFLLAILDAGASILFGLLAGACSLQILANYPPMYSVYPMAYSLLVGGVGVFALAFQRRWSRRFGGHLLVAVGLGLYVAFAANNRTSHFPIYLAFAAIYGWASARASSPARRAGVTMAWAAASTIVVLACYSLVSAVLVWRLDPPGKGRSANYWYHTVAHPVVLAVALPESDLSRREGIRWDDAVGIVLAQRAIREATYLGPLYEKAMWRYYRGLWRRFPAEMRVIYSSKAALAGIFRTYHLATLPYGRRLLKRVLRPLTFAPNGKLLTASYGILAAVGVIALWRRDAPVWLAGTLCAVAAVALQIESTMILPGFYITVHGYLLLAAVLATLVAIQVLVNVGHGLLVRGTTLRRAGSAA